MQTETRHPTTAMTARRTLAPATARGPQASRSLRRWFVENTFVPDWLPARWRRPAVSFAFAIALEVAAALATLGFVRTFPTFSFPEALIILVVAMAALTWGAGPSLAATLVGTLLLEVAVLPNTPHGGVQRAGDMLEIALVLVVGGTTSVVASGTERARRKAVQAYARSQARELALRETNARTDEFLSIAGHELRTPLTSLKMALQLSERRLQRLAKRDEISATELRDQIASIAELLDTAEHQVDAQNRLVGDLLDVTRVRTGKLEFHVERCDLAAIVRDATTAQRLAWPGRLIELDAPDGEVPVSADAQRIEQVVTNYLTNALKYSPGDAPVAVSLRVRERQARVAVRDHGAGLTREQQQHVWERFHRVPGVKQQSGSGAGLGLGLYICRGIIDRHGGRVGLESAPGKGSTFDFTLPLAH
jgi:signal transduction histidine kinase